MESIPPPSHCAPHISPQDPEGRPTEASIEDHGDGTFTVRYLPRLVGRYSITVRYGGDDIPASPFCIHAAPSGDASKCHVTGACPIDPCCAPHIPVLPHRCLLCPIEPCSAAP